MSSASATSSASRLSSGEAGQQQATTAHCRLQRAVEASCVESTRLVWPLLGCDWRELAMRLSRSLVKAQCSRLPKSDRWQAAHDQPMSCV